MFKILPATPPEAPGTGKWAWLLRSSHGIGGIALRHPSEPWGDIRDPLRAQLSK